MNICIGKKYKCRHPDVKYVHVDYVGGQMFSKSYSCTIELVNGDSITCCDYAETGCCVFVDTTNSTLQVSDVQDLDLTELYEEGTAFRAMQDILNPNHPDLKNKICPHGEYVNMAFSEHPDHAKWCCKYCGNDKTDCEEELAERSPDYTGKIGFTIPVGFKLMSSTNPFGFGQCDDDD